MRKILITNDDGIDADGIIRLAETAKEFGEVYVVAPYGQRSAASHSIVLRDPIDILPHDFPVEGVHAYSCSGMPGDCVRVGALNIVPGKPDVILSGINFGYNVASDTQYSATVGAALEGAFQEILSIAFSEGINNDHSVADKYLRDILAELIEKPFVPGKIINVNFPQVPVSECKGILYDRKVSKGVVYKDHYNKLEDLPGGGARYMVEGVHITEAEEGTDYRALLDKYISIGYVTNVS